MSSNEKQKPRIKKRKFKLNVIELEMSKEDAKLLHDNYLHLKEMHKLAAKATAELKPIFLKEIAALRQGMRNDYAYKGWEAVISLGQHTYREEYPYYPTLKDVKNLRAALLSQIDSLKKERSRYHRVVKDFQGMRYEMSAPKYSSSVRAAPADRYEFRIPTPSFTPRPEGSGFSPAAGPIMASKEIMPGFGGGAVFTEPGTILAMLKSSAYAQRITRPKRPYDKANYVGVELEVITKISREHLNEIFIKNKLAGSVYVKHDGSIQVEEASDVTHEVTLIAKEEYIYEVVKRVCAIITGPDVKGYVNNSCGLHVHIDMRNRKPEVCYENFKHSLGVLAGMVPANRTTGSHAQQYCKLLTNNTFQEAYDSRDRYRAINAVSYGSHNTLEIRLHSGSANALKINNWIELLLAMANRKTAVAATVNVDMLQEAFGISDELLKYVKMRTDKFKNRSLDTRTDHFEVAI